MFADDGHEIWKENRLMFRKHDLLTDSCNLGPSVSKVGCMSLLNSK